MVNAQQWLDKNYPKHTRKQVTRLDISNRDLEGGLNLEGFENLEYFNGSKNFLTSLDISKIDATKFRELIIYDNNFFSCDLSFLAPFTKMVRLLVGSRDDKRIKQGIYNRFCGSLEHLKEMNNLRELDVTVTDIDSGIEHLPKNLETIHHCSASQRPEAKVLVIAQDLEKINENKNLFKAAKDGNTERIKKIIKEEGININSFDKYKNTALHYTASKGHLEATKFLLELKAKSDNLNKRGLTPLQIAVINNHYEVVNELLKSGADPNTESLSGNTALHFAAEQNNLELLKLLADEKYKGDVNAVNKLNWSVLHSAASGIINKKEDWEIIRWLLKREDLDREVRAKNRLTVEDVFAQRDWSYAQIYNEILEEFPQRISQQN